MKTYFVTGGMGFIGSNFILYMLKKYPDIRIINYDKLTYAGNLENLNCIENNPNYSFIQGDICNKNLLEKVFTENNIDYVVNFAAESHVDRSIENPEIFIETNILGTSMLLNTARKFWEKKNSWRSGVKYIQISTDEVYGSLGKTGYFTETTPLNPHSPYSASKASADLLVYSFWNTYKMPINITRCSNNYGPYQFPEKLIPLAISNCIKQNKVPIYGDGLNIRDWLYVEDHCNAIDMVITNGKLGEVYNIGGHNEKTNLQIVNMIIAFLNENYDKRISKELIEYVEDRKGHDKRYGIDANKIKKELGWYPKTNFESGINKTIWWYLGNQEWINNIISSRVKCKFEYLG
jgi:dTDP-glucose 4,6-dehydratase